MVYYIKKIADDNIEMLQHVSETDLRKGYLGEPEGYRPTNAEKQMAMLYQAIAERENYFQLNLPTAYGNPDYALLDGIVRGLRMAMEVEEFDTQTEIIILKNGKRRMVIDRISRPQWYYEAVRKNRELLENL